MHFAKAHYKVLFNDIGNKFPFKSQKGINDISHVEIQINCPRNKLNMLFKKDLGSNFGQL